MRQPQTIEDAIRTALLNHADVAHLPLSTAHVRAQAAVATRAAQAWVAVAKAHPMPPVAHPNKPVPPERDLPPDHPTPTGARCCRPACGSAQPTVGWRWYVTGGWQPVCSRHMGGATMLGRRHNTDYAQDGGA